jgi:hypothetical protein
MPESTDLVEWSHHSNRERPRSSGTMNYNQNTWHLAKLMLEQHGQNAMHGARAVSANLRDQHHRGRAANCLDVVRAMDFLLSDEGSSTIH